MLRRRSWSPRSIGWRRTASIRSDIHEVIVHDAPARSKLAMAAIFIVLIGAAAGFVMSRGYMTAPVSAAHDPVSVLIGDFENRTGDPMFDGVVEQALGLGIEGASFINSFSRRDAMRAAEAIKPGSKLDEQTSRLVAFRENLGLAVIGDRRAERIRLPHHDQGRGSRSGRRNEVHARGRCRQQGGGPADRRRDGRAGAHGPR